MIKRRVKVIVEHTYKDTMGEMHSLKKGATPVLTFKSERQFKDVLALNKLRELPMKAPQTRERRQPVEEAEAPTPDMHEADKSEGNQEVE